MGKIFKTTSCMLMGIFFLTPLFAQTPDTVTRATSELDRLSRFYQEKEPAPAKKIQTEQKMPQAPAMIDEKLKFYVSHIEVTGVQSFSALDFRPIIRKYENKRISFSELSFLARELEREYLKKGIVAVCFVPPQDLRGTSVIVQTIEAKMGNLNIEDHRFYNKKRIPRYWETAAEQVLRYDALSRDLQRINKIDDRYARAVLSAGEKPQTTDVNLSVKTNFPVHILTNFDREGSTSTGEKRYGYGIKHNNLLGLDDSLVVGAINSKHSFGDYASYRVPITGTGTYLTADYSFSSGSPKKEFTIYDIQSISKNYAVALRQDLFIRDSYLGETYVSFAAKDKTIYTLDEVYNRDRLRNIVSGVDLTLRQNGAINSLSLSFTQGINGFGALRKNAFTSRGAKNTFSKFNISLSRQSYLWRYFQTTIKFNGQFTTTKLPSQEQASLGGIDSVRGYSSGYFLADNMVSPGLELGLPIPLPFLKIKIPFEEERYTPVLTPFIFGDYAYGKKRNSPNDDALTCDLMGAGWGLRIRLPKRTQLTLAWGVPVDEESPREGFAPQFHFSVSAEY